MSYAEAAKEAETAVKNDAKKVNSKAEKEFNAAAKEADAAKADLKSAAQDAKDKASKKVKEIGDEIKKAEKDAADKLKKGYEENKGPVIDFFKNIANKISEAASYVALSTKSATATASEELKNPVVASQTVITIGAIAGLIYGINERARIFRFKSDNEITCILASLTGLIVLDGFLFTKYYPKYDKKSLK